MIQIAPSLDTGRWDIYSGTWSYVNNVLMRQLIATASGALTLGHDEATVSRKFR